VSNAFLAYSDALNITYESKADYENRVTLFQATLFQVAQINAEAQTYYVRAGGWWEGADVNRWPNRVGPRGQGLWCRYGRG